MTSVKRQKIGILLSNLGTPDSPKVPDVRRYLREFLMDRYVIDIPYFLRWILVNLLILPKRPHDSAEAYEKVWTERGSPLLFHSLDLRDRVSEKLGPEYAVVLGMRYGSPSIESAVQSLLEQGVSEIRFYPLYPQYSYAATSSSLECFESVCNKLKVSVPTRVLRYFYQEPEYINAVAESVRTSAGEIRPGDYVLFSFHGVPERQLAKAADDYREHSYATAKAVQKVLGIHDDHCSVSFQSRLGRTKWIEPYTDLVLPVIAKRPDLKRIIVVSASFVADCLETIEELGIRGREQFNAEKVNADAEFILAPSLNANAPIVNALVKWIQAGK